MKKITLGSLFDGSGGFPLAARNLGMEPIWASEIEPFPVLVTRKNFPEMKHLGSITQLKGNLIEPVDVITFGSPCQDLSIAGKREGLRGKRSNLFYEAIRLVKEMRRKTNGEYPKFIIWENVCGAFTSNKGEDFRCVLESISKIKDENISIPQPSKWQQAGEIMGRSFSIAWRVLDAQYFGVPQRRKRIFLVADFTGRGAKQVLFNEESVSRDFGKSANETETTTASSRKSITESIGRSNVEAIQENESKNSEIDRSRPPCLFENHGKDCRYKGPLSITPTLCKTLGTGGNNQPFVVENIGNFDVRLTSVNTKNKRHNVYETSTSRALDTGGNNPNGNQGGVAIVSVYSTSKNSFHTFAHKEKTSTLVASDYKDPPIVSTRYCVRRITPLECGRLQGFPDDWCKDLEIKNPSEDELVFWRELFEQNRVIQGKEKRKSDKQIIKWLSDPFTDSAQYKMWGNGVALPCVMFVLSGVKFLLNKQLK